MFKRIPFDELVFMSPRELNKLLFEEITILYAGAQYIKDLLNAGASLEARDRDGWTPLHWIAFKDRVTVANVLLEEGAQVDSRSDNGKTPLNIAACYGGILLAEVFIEAGASLEAQDDLGWTPLHRAVDHGRINMIKFLIEAGAPLDAEDRDGETPWDIANLRVKEAVPELNPDYNG